MAADLTTDPTAGAARYVPDEVPAYVYDLAEARLAWARLHGALPQPSALYYSVKANPHPDVVATFAALGAGADICSTGELDIALEAGIAPQRMLYTGPGKSDTEVAAAIKAGLRHFSADSPHALDVLDRVAAAHGAELDCLLRVNDDRPMPGQGLTMTGVTSQFGADAAWVEQEPEAFADRPRVRVTGLHLYMGSNLADEDALLAQFEQALRTAVRLRAALPGPIETLDLGGGFGAPYARPGTLPEYPALAGRLGGMLDAAFPGWRDGAPRVVFESGRYLASTCGRLVTRVLDVKRSQGRPVVVLESGVHHLGGMSGLRRLPQITPGLTTATIDATIDAASTVDGSAAAVADTLIAGPLCTPLDVWAGRGTVPPLAPGQLVEVPNVGAYGLTASLLAFLGHPIPAEIVIDGSVQRISRLRLHRERGCDPGEE